MLAKASLMQRWQPYRTVDSDDPGDVNAVAKRQLDRAHVGREPIGSSLETMARLDGIEDLR